MSFSKIQCRRRIKSKRVAAIRNKTRLKMILMVNGTGHSEKSIEFPGFPAHFPRILPRTPGLRADLICGNCLRGSRWHQ